MADIVLKDRNGNDVTYEGIKTVTFDTTTEGEQATFTEGVAIEGLEIVPDFSDGDMPIYAPDGMLVKSATIKMPETQIPENIRNGVNIGGVEGGFIGDTEKVTVDLNMADGDMVISPSAVGKVLSQVSITKPKTLVPENIAEGVDIAGIIGTLAAGGKIATGTLENDVASTTATIEHNLGVVPDLILCITSSTSAYPTVLMSFGVSKAFSEAYGFTHTLALSARNGSNAPVIQLQSAKTIDVGNSFSAAGYIQNATETTFKLGSNTNYNMKAGSRWIAIGGLT